MAAGKALGIANFAKLDPLTVGLGRPEALGSLLSHMTEITVRFASLPFSQLELKDPKNQARAKFV